MNRQMISDPLDYENFIEVVFDEETIFTLLQVNLKLELKSIQSDYPDIIFYTF